MNIQTQPSSKQALLSPRYLEGVQTALRAHATQTRKSNTYGKIPYLSHVLAVSSLVMEFGGDEDQAIAGLLHDTIEDGGSSYEAEIRKTFGTEVCRLVLACTDGTLDEKKQWNQASLEDKQQAWKTRKTKYLNHLEHVDDRALLVIGSDKFHNTQTLVRDLHHEGLKTFKRFVGRQEGTLWYYESIGQVFRQRPQVAISTCLIREIDTFNQLAQSLTSTARSEHSASPLILKTR